MLPIPYTVLINPVIELFTNDMEEEYEACLSVGSLKGKVPRYTHLRYRGFDEKGVLIEREVDGLHARVVQHEYDHLDGVVFLDRVRDYVSLGFHEELMAAEQAAKNESGK
jgi:peptide deformylase